MTKEKPLIGEEKPVEGYLKKWSEHARPIIKQVEKRESKVVEFNLFRATRELVKQMKP